MLIPRPETEHLVEAVIEHLPANGQVWDLGTGSGAVAVTVALERTDAVMRASDISGGALAIARKNAETLGARVEFALGSQSFLLFHQNFDYSYLMDLFYHSKFHF